MDEYYTLDKVSERDLLGFFKLLFVKNKIKKFEDLNNLSKWQILSTFKSDSEANLDIIGGCFGILGYYIQDFMQKIFQKSVRGSEKDKPKRFEWLQNKIKEYEEDFI